MINIDTTIATSSFQSKRNKFEGKTNAEFFFCILKAKLYTQSLIMDTLPTYTRGLFYIKYTYMYKMLTLVKNRLERDLMEFFLSSWYEQKIIMLLC